MRLLFRLGLFVVLAIVMAGLAVAGYFVAVGVSAKPQPSRAETVVATSVRNLALARHAGAVANPVAGGEAAIAEARAHFADHCASCHANNGSGDTEMGRGLSPRAPDMRLPATQSLSDAELFYIIENGVRLTGMPGWSTGTRAGEEASWRLVHFIRHLPSITPGEVEEMEALNPRSPEEIRQEIAAEQFLQGNDTAPVGPEEPTHAQGHAHE